MLLTLEDLIKQIHRSRWNRIARPQTRTGHVEGLVTAGHSKLANEEFKVGTVALHPRCRDLHRQEMLGTCGTAQRCLYLLGGQTDLHCQLGAQTTRDPGQNA